MTEATNANAANTNNVTDIGARRNESIFRVFTSFMRQQLVGRLSSFGGRRDYGKIFGWDTTISPDMMLYMYNRGGIAKRVVDAFPDAIWARPPQIWAEGDDAWTAAWDAMLKATPVWPALYRLDKLASLGHYAVLVIGTNRPGLEMPLRNAKELRFLQPYGESSIQISKWDSDPTSPNYGRPILYRVYPDGGSGLVLNNTTGATSTTSVGSTRSSFLVHASRVLHIARGQLDNEIYGQPAMAPIWDYLTDLRKVVGSSSESYWINANRGLQANVDKDMAMGAPDAAALENEIQEFYDGFRRFIRTKGVEMNTLENDLADPKSPFDVLVTLISGATGIPQRILLGSEAGQLASTQDKGNWAERIEENRALHVEPTILVPFIRRMHESGVLPVPNGNVKVLWPDAYRMSPLERGQTQAQTARSLANIVKALESKSPRAARLLSDIEARAVLGFASDNRVLEDDPNP